MNNRLRILLQGAFFALAICPPSFGATTAVTPRATVKSSQINLHKKVIRRQIWNFQRADIRSVIQTVADLTHKNFIIDPRVEGKVTMLSKKPMTMGELYSAFLSMLQTLNFAAIPAGDVIKIVPAMQAKQFSGATFQTTHITSNQEIVVRVITVNNISSQQLVPVLRPLVEEWGSISAYRPSNTIILTGSSANVTRLMNIVHSMDNKNSSSITVIHLHYAQASKIAAMIERLQSANHSQGITNNFSISADDDNNSILVSGNTVNQTKVKKLIASLDTAENGSRITTQVVYLNYLSAAKIAPILNKIASGNLGKSDNTTKNSINHFSTSTSSGQKIISIEPVVENNALILNGPLEEIHSLQAVIKHLDVRPDQVLVQAIIVQVDQGLLNKLGIEWGSTNPNVNAEVITPDTFPRGIGFIPHGNLQVLVQALNTSTSTNVLATPSIVVLNNKPAIISDGKNVGILNRSYEDTSDNSTAPFNTYDRKDVTLQLKVTPQITPNNTVSLEIDQQNNSLDPEVASTPDNPTFDTSKIKTNVLVNSGDVLVLGGLISNNDKETLNKIPLLGSIPIIGKLFQYKNHEREKKNLMVFIRPIILKNKSDIVRETSDKYNYMRNLQWHRKYGASQQLGSPVLPALKNKNTIRLPPPFE